MKARLQPAAVRSHAERLASRDGYFQPASVIRRVGNTPVTPFLGGGAAVLLQVAHPLVAAGVAAHSDYRHDLWRRLARTLRALYLITFGSKQEAEHAAAVVQAVHRHINGTTTSRPSTATSTAPPPPASAPTPRAPATPPKTLNSSSGCTPPSSTPPCPHTSDSNNN